MSVASAVYEQTCHVCALINYFFYRIYIDILRSRQISVNRKIYEEIRRSDRDADYYLEKMNQTANEEYNERLKRITWPWSKTNTYDGL